MAVSGDGAGEDLITDSTFSDQADQLYFGGPAVGSWYYAGGGREPDAMGRSRFSTAGTVPMKPAFTARTTGA